MKWPELSTGEHAVRACYFVTGSLAGMVANFLVRYINPDAQPMGVAGAIFGLIMMTIFLRLSLHFDAENNGGDQK